MDLIQGSNFVFSAYLTLFNVIIFFIQLNESATINDLKVACGIKYKGSKQDMFFDNIPENCTSIIMNSNDFLDEESFCDLVKAKKPNVPFFLIEDSVPFESWVTEFDKISKWTKSIRTYADIIDKYELDGILFDNFYPEDPTDDSLKEDIDIISNGIPLLFNSIKERFTCKNKDIILGIVLPWDPEIITYGFSYEIIDNAVDVYLCNSTNYVEECPTNGGSLATPCKIRETARNFYSYSDSLQYITKSKIVMELQLSVKDAKYNTEISYEESCALCPGIVVCQDTIKSLYTKGLVIYEFEFAGAYIRYCNQDDNHGWCYCDNKTPYPGVRAIAAGIQGMDLDYIECLSFGVPGIYRPNDICENSLTCPLPPLTESPPLKETIPVVESPPLIESHPLIEYHRLIEPPPLTEPPSLIEPLPNSDETEESQIDIYILIFPPDKSSSDQVKSTQTSLQTESYPNLNIDYIAQMLIPEMGN